MENPTITAYAPGRINIIGEHTDYNNGFVLPASIDKKAVVQLKKNGKDSTICHFVAKNVDEIFEFDLNEFEPIGGGWENYIMGVVAELQALGGQITGFDCELEGDVPIGSGMSSSAALECSLAVGLNELFDLGFEKWQLIKAAQMAEHHFVGIECGIMDQFASVMGKKNQVMLLDCKSLEFEYFPLDLEDYELLLLNTNVSHALASSEYNTRKRECEKGVEIAQQKYLEVTSLRDLTVEMLSEVIGEMPEKVASRCRHIVTENDRVQAATKALVAKDFARLGELIYESHNSLQVDYEVSCKELDFLVEYTKDKDYILGGRMMGGGFGGCTINIIQKTKVNDFIQLAAAVYQKEFNKDLTPYSVSIENGAGVL
ncbi:MAG: galactokinase [Saprospiraceae bacterium]